MGGEWREGCVGGASWLWGGDRPERRLCGAGGGGRVRILGLFWLYVISKTGQDKAKKKF